MIKSSKPRKQRKFRHTAPAHAQQHFAHAHISKELSAKLKIKKRSIQVRKGDTVKVMSGKKKGMTGKVSAVDLKRSVLYIDSYSRKDAKGKEKPVPVSISNVYITDLNLSDKKRAQKLNAPTTMPKRASVEANAK